MQRGTGEAEKSEAAKIFYNQWKLAEANEHYTWLKKQWKKEKGLTKAGNVPALEGC